MNKNDAADWLGKPYYSLDAYFKHTYGQKIYKIAVDAGLTCPNRDGSIDTRGCAFCSAGGSGDFAVAVSEAPYEHRSGGNSPYGFMYDRRLIRDNTEAEAVSVKRRIERGIAKFNKRVGEKFVIYFQAYTNTYGDREYLRKIWTDALMCDSVVGISIATRPDCLGLGGEPWQKKCAGVIELIDELKRKFSPMGKFIWVELGLQTIHDGTAERIRRGYPLKVYDEAASALDGIGVPYITHIILGLPDEDCSMMLETVRYVTALHPFGIKLQLLHILSGTDMACEYEQGRISVMSMEEYIDTVIAALRITPPEIVIHRVTGDGPKNILLAPDWSANKRVVLNTLHGRMRRDDVRQGDLLH